MRKENRKMLMEQEIQCEEAEKSAGWLCVKAAT